uniref:RING-type domain-containing protein n=1 Tax=Oryza brachyantha TaxID=4533 RepID=J3N7M7_ORYBR
MVIKRERLSPEIDDGSDHTVTFHCAICMEHKPTHSRHFCCGGCPHYFCFSCIVDHIGYRELAGGDIHVPCPELGCTVGELAYGKWYEHVTADVPRAWEVAILLDYAMLERCGSCGKFLEGVTVEGMMEGVKDNHHMDPLHSLAAAKGWLSCPRCGMLIELIGGCSIITCQ